MSSIINGFEERIVGLSGVEKSTSGALSYNLDGVPFITDVTKNTLVLHMTKFCLGKLSAALKSETRVLAMDEDAPWVKFQFNDDVDKEFVFLYIRFSWKHFRSKVEAA